MFQVVCFMLIGLADFGTSWFQDFQEYSLFNICRQKMQIVVCGCLEMTVWMKPLSS